MKKLIILGIAAIAIMLGTGTVSAGEFHSGTSLNCNQCHVLHYSEQHPFSRERQLEAGGPFKHLLRAGDVNDLCLYCHDNEGEPDVLTTDFNVTESSDRPAGALNMEGVADPLWAATDGHTLKSHLPAPGATTWTNEDGLDCADCHQVHGRKQDGVSIYRNLNIWLDNFAPTPYMTYAVTTNDLTKDVFTSAGREYDASVVNYNMPDPTGSAYAKFCGQCHTNFHGTADDANMRELTGPAGTEWKRHPVQDAMIGAVGGGHSNAALFASKAYRVKVMSASGDWGPNGAAWTTTPTDVAPSCMSCHKAHGSQRPFGLILATGNAAIGENGDATASNYADLCRQCHVQ